MTRRPWFWLAVASGLTLAIIVNVVLLATWRPFDADAAPPRAVMTVFGTLEVFDEGRALPTNQPCEVLGRYAGVRRSSPVTVSSVNPRAVLGTGMVTGGNAVGGACLFTWAVTGVERGHSTYEVAFGDYDPFRVDESIMNQALPFQFGTP